MINCIIVDDEPMAREILENHLQKIDTIQLIGTCKNAIEAFNLINTHKIDLIFLFFGKNNNKQKSKLFV